MFSHRTECIRSPLDFPGCVFGHYSLRSTSWYWLRPSNSCFVAVSTVNHLFPLLRTRFQRELTQTQGLKDEWGKRHSVLSQTWSSPHSLHFPDGVFRVIENVQRKTSCTVFFLNFAWKPSILRCAPWFPKSPNLGNWNLHIVLSQGWVYYTFVCVPACVFSLLKDLYTLCYLKETFRIVLSSSREGWQRCPFTLVFQENEQRYKDLGWGGYDP